jgi:hypothetical protein
VLGCSVVMLSCTPCLFDVIFMLIVVVNLRLDWSGVPCEVLKLISQGLPAKLRFDGRTGQR